jgi:hypothetical protein
LARKVRHKHWPEDHPFYERAKWHYSTLKECDRIWTQYWHGHEGIACDKQVLPGNVTATCVLTMTPEQLAARLSKRVSS